MGGVRVSLARDFAIAWRRRALAVQAAKTTEQVIADGAKRGLSPTMAIFAHAFGEHAAADHPMARSWKEPWDS